MIFDVTAENYCGIGEFIQQKLTKLLLYAVTVYILGLEKWKTVPAIKTVLEYVNGISYFVRNMIYVS